MKNKTKRKRFWTPDGFFVTERVAANNPVILDDRPAIPTGCNGLFLFRVDADIYIKEGQKMILETARKYDIKTTWFVNIAGYQGNLKAITPLIDDRLVEVQSHAYFHCVFKKKDENKINLNKAEKFLDPIVKRQIKGVVSPYGYWNVAYQTAMEELGFAYSSEFSLAYDMRPFYPVINGRRSSVLQIPIHPVCTGSFLFSRLPYETACTYFEKYIMGRCNQGLPIILYSHPNDVDVEYNKKVLDHIFKTVSSLPGIKCMNFVEYHNWWQAVKNKDNNQAQIIPLSISADMELPTFSFGQTLKYKINCLIAEVKNIIINDVLSENGRRILLKLWKGIKICMRK